MSVGVGLGRCGLVGMEGVDANTFPALGAEGRLLLLSPCLPTAVRDPILGDVGCSFQCCSKPKGVIFSTHPDLSAACCAARRGD